MRFPALLSSDPLTIYLNDHLAGSVFGLELARRARAENRGSEFGAFLDELAVAIEQDRKELERIIERLGRRRDRLKSTAGWLAEKAGRLKLNDRLVGYSPLSRLVELEAIYGGVQAKLALWRALQAIAPGAAPRGARARPADRPGGGTARGHYRHAGAGRGARADRPSAQRQRRQLARHQWRGTATCRRLLRRRASCRGLGSGRPPRWGAAL